MMVIAICDDSSTVLKDLSDLIKRYAKETDQSIKICKYNSGIQLLDKYTGNYDIIFLDIKMPNLSGIETANGIRKRDKQVSIIFLTSLVEHALDGYKVQALDYIIKPISYKRLKMELDVWQDKQVHEQEPFIIVKNNNGRYKILLKHLTYIETYNRRTLIHTKGDKFVCYKRLKILEGELKNKGVVRCHTSYLVNLGYIDSIEKADAKLISGETIPISQMKRKKFMQSLARYWGERI